MKTKLKNYLIQSQVKRLRMLRLLSWLRKIPYVHLVERNRTEITSSHSRFYAITIELWFCSRRDITFLHSIIYNLGEINYFIRITLHARLLWVSIFKTLCLCVLSKLMNGFFFVGVYLKRTRIIALAAESNTCYIKYWLLF